MADSAKLVATIEARTVQFERALKRIEQQTDRTFRGGQNNVVRFNRGLDASAASATRLERAMGRVNAAASGRLGSFGRGLAGGIVGAAGVGAVLSLGGAITKARDALASFDAIAKAARTTGLSPELYQSLTFAATETGISQEQLNAALLIFNKNAGLAASGTGALVTGLKRVNPELLKAINLAETQDERLRLVAEAMRQAGSAAERAALSSIAFGRTGVELTEIFGGGAAALDDFMRRATEMGLIIDRSLLDKADELDDKLSVLAQVIDTNLNVALIEAAPLLVAVSEAVAQTAKEVRELVEWWRSLVTVMNQTPEGSEMLERFKGLAFDLDLGASRMEAFRQSAAGLAIEAQKAAERVSKLIEAALDPRSGGANDAIIRDLGLLHALLSEGTPDAARKAQEVLKRLAEGDPRLRSLPEQFQPLIDKLLEVAGAAGEAADAVAGIPTATIRPSGSASDLARAAGGRQAAQARSSLYASPDAVSRAAELLKGFEGFRANSYYDVNAYRVGYGSDTKTDATGAVSRVTKESVTNVAEAMRDLTRRIAETQTQIINSVGEAAYSRLSAETKAALISVAYNYGELPKRLIAAVQGGDPNTIAIGIQRLGRDNGGVNQGRRNAEAASILGGAASAADVETVTSLADAYKKVGLSVDEAGKATDKFQVAQDAVAERIDSFRDAAQDVLGGFISDLIHGKDAADALRDALGNVADRLLDMALNGLFDGLFGARGAGGGGVLGGILGRGAAAAVPIIGGAGLFSTPSAPVLRASPISVPRPVNAGGGVKVENIVINNTPMQVTQREERTPGGGRRTTTVIDEMTAGAIARGPNTRRALAGGYGAAPRIPNLSG